MRWLQKSIAWSLELPLRLMSLMPPRWHWWLGQGVAWLWWDVLRLRRFTVYRNLTIVFPEKTKADRKQIARESLRWMGYGFFETLQVPSFEASELGSRVEFRGLENFVRAQEQGRGVLLLSLHLGSGDAAMGWMSLAGLPVTLISKQFARGILNDVWFGIRARQGSHFISAHGKETAFEILKALKRGRGVVFVLDQFMGRPFGIPSRFFGRLTGTAYGLALFAARTKATVLTIHTYRTADLKTVVEFGPEISFEAHPDQDLQTLRMTEKYNHALESLIRRYPEQWMWVHRRWKRFE